MGDAITASFGLSLDPLKKGFQDAKTVAREGAAEVERAITSGSAAASRRLGAIVPINWNNVLAQSRVIDPLEERRRRNSAAGFAPAPAGKYPEPGIEGGNNRIRSSIGIAAARFLRTALALGGATEVIGLIEQAAEKLNSRRNQLIAITQGIGSSGFRSTGDIQANLAGATSQLNDLRQSEVFDRSSGFRSAIASARDFVTGDSPEERKNAQIVLRQQASSDIDALARKQEKLNEAELESISGSEKKAALLKEESNYMTRLYELARAEAAAGVNNPSARNAENARHTQANEVIERRAELQQAAVEAEIRLNLLAKDGVTASAQQNERLKERIGLLQRELAHPVSDERRDAISAERIGLEAQQGRGLLVQSRRSFQDRQSEILAARKDKFDLERLNANAGLLDVHRNTSGDVISGIDPFTNERKSVTPVDRFRKAFPKVGETDKSPTTGSVDVKGQSATVGGSGSDTSAIISAINNPAWVKQ